MGDLIVLFGSTPSGGYVNARQTLERLGVRKHPNLELALAAISRIRDKDEGGLNDEELLFVLHRVADFVLIGKATADDAHVGQIQRALDESAWIDRCEEIFGFKPQLNLSSWVSDKIEAVFGPQPNEWRAICRQTLVWSICLVVGIIILRPDDWRKLPRPTLVASA